MGPGLYQRYASGDHHDGYFLHSGLSLDTLHNDTALSDRWDAGKTVVILPMVNKNCKETDLSDFSVSRWHKLFEYLILFHGHERKTPKSVFSNIFVFLYGDDNARSLTPYGVSEFKQLLVSPKSRFWPACENLVPEYRNDHSRNTLAITSLKQYSVLANLKQDFPIPKTWDETKAGELASSMDTVVLNEKMLNLLLQLGLLQPHWITSAMLDVVYDSSDATHIADDNLMVSRVGQQLDQLFDPLMEYSPESLHKSYQTPKTPPLALDQPSPSIAPIIGELLKIQTNVTMKLVDLIQKFIIPLRIEVLAANAGITKVNQVFPPTIDEITRINCILHDSLTRAKPYGYTEILKALATVLPYFYKAFIRHEANVKTFGLRLKRFYEKNRKTIFENAQINQGSFTLPEIESIVVGSLLELPKFKLILQRLLKTTKQRHMDEYNMEEIEKYYNASIEVIDAFGEADLVQESSGRIFTPTGKILTELAFNWPSELQFGWLNRKAIGIFELTNVKPQKVHNYRDVIIIFSDSILFLTIEDRNYYDHLKRSTESKKLSVSDILMHSLVNQKPLPSVIPSMRVAHWCGINEVLVSAYDGPNGSTMLRILNITEDGFYCKDASSLTAEYAKSYEIVDTDTNAEKIMDLVNKARILFKDQPFHLFKSSNSDGLQFYSSAHELSLYNEEQCKSPFALFLNVNFENPESYFEDHPYLQLIICSFLVESKQVQLKALNRTLDYQLEKTVPLDQFQAQVQSILIENYSLMLNSFNSITQSLTRANEIALKYFADRSHADSPVMRNVSKNAEQVNPKKEIAITQTTNEEEPSKPVITLQPPKGLKETKPQKDVQINAAEEKEKKKRRRRSWAHALWPFKKHKADKSNKTDAFVPLERQQTKELKKILPSRKSLDNKKSLSGAKESVAAPLQPTSKPLKEIPNPQKNNVDPKIPRRKSMEVLAAVVARKKPSNKEHSSVEIIDTNKHESTTDMNEDRYEKKADAFIPKGQKMKYTNLLTATPALIDDSENNTTDAESAVVPAISLPPVEPVSRGSISQDVHYRVPVRENSISAPVLQSNGSQSESPTDTIFGPDLTNDVHTEVEEVQQKTDIPTKGLVVEKTMPNNTGDNGIEVISSAQNNGIVERRQISDEINQSKSKVFEDIRRANSTSSSVIRVPLGSLNLAKREEVVEAKIPEIFATKDDTHEMDKEMEPAVETKTGSEAVQTVKQQIQEAEVTTDTLTEVPPRQKRTIWSKKPAVEKQILKQKSIHRPPPKVKSVDDINMIGEDHSETDLTLHFEESYYDDGTQNWAIINRDNSSILNTHALLDPLGGSVSQKVSRRVESKASHTSAMTKHSSIEEIFQDIIERYDNITLSGSQDSLVDAMRGPHFTASNAFKARQNNMSTRSLTPSEFASQLEKDIITKFYTEDTLYEAATELEITAQEEDEDTNSSIEFIGSKPTRVPGLSSSEEEYYSVPEASASDDSENVIVLEKSPARSFVSSDGTIIDDSEIMVEDKHLVPPTPPPHGVNSRIVSSNSIAYLSEYIQ